MNWGVLFSVSECPSRRPRTSITGAEHVCVLLPGQDRGAIAYRLSIIASYADRDLDRLPVVAPPLQQHQSMRGTQGPLEMLLQERLFHDEVRRCRELSV